MTDAQQIYHAAPDHRLWDILKNIHPHGLAIPGDGDSIARHTRTHNDHLAREYHGASRAEWLRMGVEMRRTIVNVYRGRLRDGRTVMKGPNEQVHIHTCTKGGPDLYRGTCPTCGEGISPRPPTRGKTS